METTQNLLSNDLQVDARITGHLKETAGWARFLGIMGFILAGLLVIVAFAVPAYLSNYRSYSRYDSYRSSGLNDSMGAMLTVLYLFCAALMFFVALFTFKFGSKTKQALMTIDQDSFDKGLMNLKFLFRFYGIIMIIYLGILVLAIVVGGLGAAFNR